ncbi:hypothetical protein [Actinomadura sp. HBU206391]|uniref:hypothetical protein n=1 Tax=Actinomadura sp. HBU206391 TaxID=2731692 RepID=UPI0016502874|nr:hypothetical protein [Actinomadura sp. HBU206391]MBC6457242.1 hypothetical protein [Actinomadura sp. HBU206391]
MSWDVFLVGFPDRVTSVEQLQPDFRESPVGPVDEVVERLRTDCAVEFGPRGSTGGAVEGDTWSIEVSVGRDDPVKGVMLCVRGAGDEVLAVIHHIARTLGCVAIDCSSGEILREGSAGSWHDFQQWRDRAIGPTPNRGPHG